MRKITFKHITNILPKPRSNGHESWEFRFLFSEGAPRRVIYVEVDEGLRMMRFTFPMDSANGRGRIWLKRSEFYEIDSQDISVFVRLIEELQRISGLSVLVSLPAHKLIVETIGATEFFENLYVLVDKRPKPRNYDDPKYLARESSNPYASSYTRARGSRLDG